MAHFVLLANTVSKDITHAFFLETGPAPGTPTMAIPDMTNSVELFVDDAHTLRAGVDAAWAAGGMHPDLNVTYKLNATDDDIEAR